MDDEYKSAFDLAARRVKERREGRPAPSGIPRRPEPAATRSPPAEPVNRPTKWPEPPAPIATVEAPAPRNHLALVASLLAVATLIGFVVYQYPSLFRGLINFGVTEEAFAACMDGGGKTKEYCIEHYTVSGRCDAISGSSEPSIDIVGRWARFEVSNLSWHRPFEMSATDRCDWGSMYPVTIVQSELTIKRGDRYLIFRSNVQHLSPGRNEVVGAELFNSGNAIYRNIPERGEYTFRAVYARPSER
jgi:hypothetical protein